MRASGAFWIRVANAWTEIRENLGRSVLQSLGIVLGVAAVLGGLSISDSNRKQSDRLYVRMGGLDKLNVQPSPVAKSGTAPSALENANLGLRSQDAADGAELGQRQVVGLSVQKGIRARVRSPYADEERAITGIGQEYLQVEGYQLAQGRTFSEQELRTGAPVALLGSEAVQTLFPAGDALERTIRVGDVPVVVVGLLKERVFRFSKNQRRNIFRWRNKIVALPAAFVQRRFEGDSYQRVERVTFKMPEIDSIEVFARDLRQLLVANHRQQTDFRLDDVAARVRKRRANGSAYDVIFMLSGVLSLLGGGLVNVNIQLASLKDRVREVGIKMAIGSSGREIFKDFIVEAMLLTALGAVAGLIIGGAFSWFILQSIGVPLYLKPTSFAWAVGLAASTGFVFALYPAFKASRLSPMEALRYD